MSDNHEATEVAKRYFYPNPKVTWTNIPEGEYQYGTIDAGDIEIDSTVDGRLDIWKVPVCDADPDGLWANLFTGQFYEAVEPGCESWNKHLLAKISFQGHKKSAEKVDEHSKSDVNKTAGFDFIDPVFRAHLDEAALNPAPVELPSIEDYSISGELGTYADLNCVFTGDTVKGTWTVKFTPESCSVKGLTGEPDTVISSGQTKQMSGTKEEINKELEHAQVLVGTAMGKITFNWDHDQSATVTVLGEIKTETK